ncbi:MAG: undecaprenyl-diphosphate phosphatase [Planctomycetota bacterium]
MSEYWWNALIKGVLEGFTEFLPISSTGHLILVRDFLPLTADSSRVTTLNALFDIVIQLPAILAIVILYRHRLWQSVRNLPSQVEPRRFWTGLFLAFLPAAVIGILFHRQIEVALESPRPVALALIVGGVVLILVEYVRTRNAVSRAEDVSIPVAFVIGVFQCLALIPGVSRSGATIVGGRLSGLNRTAAAEFSFFLALPTMVGACVYKMFQAYKDICWSSDGPIILIGCVASFVTAIVVAYWFIRFLQRHSLAVFGWYRIAIGLTTLILAHIFFK